MFLDQTRDNASGELVDCARAGDEEGFRALASCLMPADEIEECWRGARARLGLIVRPALVVYRTITIPGRSFAHPTQDQFGGLFGRCETSYPDPVCACGAIRLEWI